MAMTWDHTQDVARKAGWITRMVLRLFARRLNREVFSPALCRMHECGSIDSRVLLEVSRHFDPTQQAGVVGSILSR